MAFRSGRFRLIHGGRTATRVEGVRIVPAPRHLPPFPVGAVVLEEDTYLVLSGKARLPERPEHPVRVMTALWEAEPLAPGTVVVRPGLRTELLAVVHDLDQEPSWREDWIRLALRHALEEANRQGVTALGMELVGCLHGRLAPERFEALLLATLKAVAPQRLERIWLMDSEDQPVAGGRLKLM